MTSIAVYTVETQQVGVRRTVAAVIPTACDLMEITFVNRLNETTRSLFGAMMACCSRCAPVSHKALKEDVL